MRSVVWEYDNTSYILTEEQADEVDTYSAGEPDDAAFNKWFLDYAKEHSIKTKTHGRAKWWSRVPDSADDVSRLVAVKQSAHTLMRVVDPSIKIEEIKFDDPDASFSIPSAPATDAKSLHEALDNTAGFTIHSAFKDRFSGMKPNEYLRIESEYASKKEGKDHILNSLVTMRSNYRGLQENPGFADYIDSAFEYVYNGYTLPEEWPSDVGEQMAALLGPSMYGSRVGDVKSKPYSDKVKQAQEIVDGILTADRAGSATYHQAVNDIYKLLDIPPKDEDEKPQPVKMPMPSTITGNENFNTKIDHQTAEKIDDRVEMQQEFMEAFGNPDVLDESVDSVNLIKIRPPRSYGSAKISGLTGSIVKADAQLRLKKTLDQRTEHFQRSGDLDEDELYRLFHGDDRVFMNVEEEQEESASIHFLIDVSGSMGVDINGGYSRRFGSDGPVPMRVEVAAQLAWLFAHSMNKRRYVKSHVWAHTGDVTPGAKWSGRGDTHWGPVVYDIWKSGEDLKRLDITLQIEMSQNYDGFAIEYVGNVLHKEEAEKKYLIVLSDGQPAGSGYGGVPAMDHMRRVTDALLKKGIHVVQIAIGGELLGVQDRMFKHWVPYENVDQTIRQFAKILDKAR